MTQRTSPGTHNNDRTGGDDTSARLDQLRALLETVKPVEAREAVREIMLLSTPNDGGEALRLAVRFSHKADHSIEELLRLWSTVDGDPDGFCENMLAPAYCARKAIRKLVPLSTPDDGGEALKLASRFVSKDKYASKLLLRLWRTAPDPDGFAEHLLAPAFRHEGRTELKLRDVVSLTGLRHLTMLDKLHIDYCREITDLTEIGELTGLTDLDLQGCAGVEDLTPIGRLTRLTRLNLSGCSAVEDTEPLLNLSRLRELDLTWTKVRSAHGFGRAFPALESLDLRFCRFFTDAGGLSGLRSLTHLEIGPPDSRNVAGLRGLPALTHLRLSGHDQLRDLSPFAAYPGLESLAIEDSEGLTTTEELGTHRRLAKLEIGDCHNLRTPEGLGEQPALQEVRLIRNRSLADLRGLGRLPALRTLMINGTAVSNVEDLAGSPLSTLTLLHMKALDSLSSLQECPGLQELTLRHCPLVEDIPADSLTTLSLSGAGWTDLSRLAGLRKLRTLELQLDKLEDITALTGLPHIAEFDLGECRSLKDLRPLLEMPSLTHITPPDSFPTFTAQGALHPLMSELKARGVTVAVPR